MIFRKTVKGNNLIYKIEGNMSFDSISSIDRLRLDIKNTSMKGRYNYIWDLSACPIISEPGVSAIVMTISIAMRTNNETILCGLNDENFELLKSFHIINQLRIFDTVETVFDENYEQPEILEFPENGIEWI